ncbi:MAG: SsrA-binding protein SmpB [Ignavibacteria bacterium]|nr:SsrA-binding protein SmpB [Ignavibacteria bacterium]
MKESPKTGIRKETIIALNKRAWHDYEILDKYEAGIQLKGTEVKSLRLKKASIAESYARIRKNEVWLINSNIPEYSKGNIYNHEPSRDRKLLLRKSEIRKLTSRLKDKSMTLIPLKLYFSGPYAKLELALAKGRKIYDKREVIRKAENQKRLKRIKI